MIPVIDLGPYLAGHPRAVAATAAELGRALEDVGFFVIVNHGIPQTLIEDTFAEARRFHAQPMETKLALRMNEHNNGQAFEIIMKAWTQPSFSHHGEFWSLPPRHTKWHHKATMAYFAMPKAGRREDVLKVGAPDMYSVGSPIMASTTTLKEISVFPQPVQKPHPQVWEPVTSERSIRWAARNKVNAFTVPEPTSRLKRNIEICYEEAEKNGWPDRLNRGRFKPGWDEPMYDLNMKVTADLIMPKEIAIVGTADEVIHKIMRIKERCGYDDFMFTAWFEAGGYSTEEIEGQMEVFAAEVMPVLRRECGGGPKLPESGAHVVPERVVAGVAGV